MTLLLQAAGNCYESRLAGNRIQPRAIQSQAIQSKAIQSKAIQAHAGALKTAFDPTLSMLDDIGLDC